jgi:hypothetical protein
MRTFRIEGDAGDISLALDRLVQAGRARDAVALAGHRIAEHLPAKQLMSLLVEAAKESVLRPKDESGPVMFQHYVEEILLEFDKRDELTQDEMASLEWTYLPILRHSRRQPIILENFLARSPEFFVQVLSALYRPDPASGVSDIERLGPEHAKAVAGHAFDLLRSWRLVPGTTGTTINATALNNWMHEARTLAAKAGRSRVADDAIGEVLGKAPNDPDGFWPPAAIRDLIESTRNRDFEHGIANGVK